MPERRKILASVLTLAFFVTLMISALALPSAFAHGGHQPPPADFGGKKASLFVSLEPLVVTTSTDPVYINARFFDENTNENFKEVTYRVYFKKDGNEVPIVTEGGQFGGQGFFYDPEGDLQIKIVPKDSETAVARGEAEPQFGGIWNRGGPVVVEGPIFTDPGLYNLFVEIYTVGTTRTQVEPVLQYDVWVTPGREEVIDVEGQQIKVRNYYGAIDSSNYDEETKTIEFSMPFDWTSDMPSRIGMLHTEVFIPKALADFNKQSLNATVNGISVPVAVDTYTPENTIVHFTISKQNLINIAEKVKSENLTPDKAVFALSPPTTEVKVAQVTTDSQNYKVALTWPEQVFPGQPVTFGIRVTDKSDQPLSAATYELVILDKDGNEVTRAGGVTTPEGVSSQDMTFASQGSFTVRVDKINASSESVQSSLSVVPEFPVGIASIAAALAIGGIIVAAKRISLFATGKTY
ncbi:hypothetical protein [Candidatus Nitrososphaera gargensis]|nr:hypothetical protein [Candidatus Nitrososphaera gargensis]